MRWQRCRIRPLGNVTRGIPTDIAAFLREVCGLTCFFETGTGFGDTAVWASMHFERVITTEAAPGVYAIGRTKLMPIAHVLALLGDSRGYIRDLLPSLPPTLFWLDAHYSGGGSHGEHEQCPLVGEIDAVAATLDRNVVMIDDVRLFAAPPPPPMSFTQWPTLCDVTDALRRHHQPYIVLWDDVLIAVPSTARAVLERFLVGISKVE